MFAAQVKDWSEGPRLVKVDKPAAPTAGQRQLRVVAAGLHQVVRTRAAGKHYSTSRLPHVPGIDCVARDEASGKLYYVMGFADTFGTFAEYINVPEATCLPLPGDVDPVRFAASVNPAMSSWMAITKRTNELPEKWTALIVGATGASGQLAGHAARALGACKVTGVARNEAALKGQLVGSGGALDDYIVLRERVEETDFSKVEADVVLDYVWGAAAQHLLNSLAHVKSRVQYVQIGTLGGEPTVPVSAPLLRSTDLTLRGAGVGSWKLPDLLSQLPRLVAAVSRWPPLAAVAVPLHDIEATWRASTVAGRAVFTP